jgi:hypothetical protein
VIGFRPGVGFDQVVTRITMRAAELPGSITMHDIVPKKPPQALSYIVGGPSGSRQPGQKFSSTGANDVTMILPRRWAKK